MIFCCLYELQKLHSYFLKEWYNDNVPLFSRQQLFLLFEQTSNNINNICIFCALFYWSSRNNFELQCVSRKTSQALLTKTGTEHFIGTQCRDITLNYKSILFLSRTTLCGERNLDNLYSRVVCNLLKEFSTSTKYNLIHSANWDSI